MIIIYNLLKKQKNKGSGKLLIAPSILSVYDKDLDKILAELASQKVPYLHLDVMDNKFVPNYTFDYKLVKKIKQKTSLIVDTHLMIQEPLDSIDEYIKTKSDILCFHKEATKDPSLLIQKIKKANLKVGMALKPNTSIDTLIPFLKDLDLVLVMSVEPGFGGQKFMPEVLEKVQALKEIREKFAYQYLIEIDGGITDKTALLAKKAGADIIVVGSYLFKDQDITSKLEVLKAI